MLEDLGESCKLFSGFDYFLIFPDKKGKYLITFLQVHVMGTATG